MPSSEVRLNTILRVSMQNQRLLGLAAKQQQGSLETEHVRCSRSLSWKRRLQGTKQFTCIIMHLEALVVNVSSDKTVEATARVKATHQAT